MGCGSVFLLAVLVAVSGRAVEREELAMAFQDPFFNEFGLQLIDPPAPSQHVLDAVARGGPPPLGTAESDEAAGAARSWAKKILREPYWPADGVPFVAFPREEGRLDAVRAQYSAGGQSLQIGQTFSLISVRLRAAPPRAGEAPDARAERYARLLLNTTKIIEFDTLGQERNLTYGRQTARARLAVRPPDEPDWAEVLRWWCRGDEVGFLTLKRSQMPQKADIGLDPETNRVWFEYYRRRP